MRVSNPCAQDDGLLTGDIEKYPPLQQSDQDLCGQIPDLIDTLEQLERHPYSAQQTAGIDFSSAEDICHKLSQLLPVDPLTKQGLLESESTSQAIDRLRELTRMLEGGFGF